VDETPVFIFLPISKLPTSLHVLKLKKQKNNWENLLTYSCSQEGRLVCETKNAAHCKSDSVDLHSSTIIHVFFYCSVDYAISCMQTLSHFNLFRNSKSMCPIILVPISSAYAFRTACFSIRHSLTCETDGCDWRMPLPDSEN